MLVCCVSFANAKNYCCHNYENIIGPGGSDKCKTTTTTCTEVGLDTYTVINCKDPGTNECPSCRVNGIVKGDIANYNENDILNFAWTQIAGGITTGELYYNGDTGVHLTWVVKPDNTVSITFTSNT